MGALLTLVVAAVLTVEPPLALDVTRDRDVLRVQFQLLEPLPENVEIALASGAAVRIRYPLRVRSPRRMWWDRKMWKGEATATATFDPITGRYRCELVLDGVIVTSQELGSAAAAREFLTRPGPVLLALPPVKRSPLWVRVRAVFASSTKWLLFPSTEGTDWVEVPITRPEPASPEPDEPDPSAG